MSHPSLTPEEAERLECLAEEAGEVVKAAMKVLRHGYDSCNPFDPKRISNRADLGKEVGNFIVVKDKMLFRGDLSSGDVAYGRDEKENNWPIYTHHQPESEGK